MFTGIVETVGQIVACRSIAPPATDLIQSGPGGLRLQVEATSWETEPFRIGESIAVQGCCLTLIDFHETQLEFDVSAETLRCTTGLNELGSVNLERALRVGDRLGGHFVAGHVDGVGAVAERVSFGESWRLEIAIPSHLTCYLAPKGSITVNGVSLTINEVKDNRCQINLIPHTIAVTTLRGLQRGSPVNIEVDLLARYAAKLLEKG